MNILNAASKKISFSKFSKSKLTIVFSQLWKLRLELRSVKNATIINFRMNPCQSSSFTTPSFCQICQIGKNGH
eukprot:UN00155